MNDETWGAICDFLKAHPTIEVLDLRASYADAATAPAVLKSRIQALLNMVKTNMSIHTLHLNSHESQNEIFRESVIPYLKTNQFRPRIRAIQKTRPITYHAKILGRALFAVRAYPNGFWMLLSGNAEVVFPSTTATTMPAANLPTPATAAATSNAAAVAATASATVTATPAASTISAFATANVAAPSADRKRSRYLGDTQSD
jgi:hypothetical protein